MYDLENQYWLFGYDVGNERGGLNDVVQTFDDLDDLIEHFQSRVNIKFDYYVYSKESNVITELEVTLGLDNVIYFKRKACSQVTVYDKRTQMIALNDLERMLEPYSPLSAVNS